MTTKLLVYHLKNEKEVFFAIINEHKKSIQKETRPTPNLCVTLFKFLHTSDSVIRYDNSMNHGNQIKEYQICPVGAAFEVIEE